MRSSLEFALVALRGTNNTIIKAAQACLALRHSDTIIQHQHSQLINERCALRD